MTLGPLIEELERTIPELRGAVGYIPSGVVPGLGVMRCTSPTPLEATVYDPCLCLILRGRKRTLAGPVSVDFGAGESLIVIHDLPAVAQVTECPYWRSSCRSTSASCDAWVTRWRPRRSSPRHLGARRRGNRRRRDQALRRYVVLARDPSEARILGPLVLKEIHFRLFRAPHAAVLRDYRPTAWQARFIAP